MADSLGPDTGGPLEEDDSGNLVLSDDANKQYKLDSFDILKSGTAIPTPATSILGVVDVGAIFRDYDLNIPPSPDLANALASDPDSITSFDATFSEFLGSTASFLNLSIDDPIGKQFGIIDPTIIIANVKTAIQDFIKNIVSLVSDALEEAREALGEKIDELLEKINFEFKDITIGEIFEKIKEILAAFAILALGKFRKGLKALLAVFNIPWIGDIIDTIVEVVQAIRAFINNADIGRKIRNRIKEALHNIVQKIKDEIKEAVMNAVLAALENLLSIPIPDLPPKLPAFILELPERARELFNIDILPFDWPQFFQLPQPNILSEIYQFFQKLIEFFTTKVPTLAFIQALLEALKEGVVGLIKFLVGIVVQILAIVFSAEPGMFLKVAALMALVVAVVKYLATTLVGLIVGDGMIFRSVKATILAGLPEVIQDEPETATA